MSFFKTEEFWREYQITKIRIKPKDDRLRIEFGIPDTEHDSVFAQVVSGPYTTARPGLLSDLKKCRQIVLRLLQTEECWDEESLTVIGVNFAHKDETLSATLNAELAIDTGDCDLVFPFTTPTGWIMPCKSTDFQFKDEEIAIFEHLIEEAQRYAYGQRAQLTIAEAPIQPEQEEPRSRKEERNEQDELGFSAPEIAASARAALAKSREVKEGSYAN